MPFLEPVTLRGQNATLEPLAPSHVEEAIEAVRDGDMWQLWYTAIPSPEKMQAEIERRLGLFDKGLMQPFAVRTPGGQFAGMTTFMNVDAANRRVEIGSTWYRSSLQRGGLNTECKLLLLGRAFGQMDCIAVEFRTHFFNHQSRRAIERLGAKQDGILRSHQVAPDGSLRDTVVYSIVASEWPTVRTHLQYQLSKPRD